MRWIYKTVHYELKKEGILGSAFLDENEIEESLNEYGKAGWELVSTLEISDGIMAIFKQPFRLTGMGVEKSGTLRQGRIKDEQDLPGDGMKENDIPENSGENRRDKKGLGVIRIE